MTETSKLKFTQKEMVIFILFLIVILIASSVVFGEQGFYWVFGSTQILMFLVHLIVMVQTRNSLYSVLSLFYLFMFFTFFPPFIKLSMRPFFAGAAAVFLVGMIGVFVSKKINWRYREILELAARPVEGTADGYTPRPFPSGSADYTRQDALGLAVFLKRYVIAYPFIEKERVVFVIPRVMWTFMLGIKRNYDKETYIAFSDSGHVSVRMAKSDYQAYKQELTFDQLCASLGNVFMEFIRLYRDGEKNKILKWLNSV